MNNFIKTKLLPAVMKVANTKVLVSIKDGMVYAMPFMLAGSFFLLIANLPIPPLTQFLNQIGATYYLNQAFGATMAIVALFAVMGIASTYVKLEGFDGQLAGMVGLASFILFLLPEVINEDGIIFAGAISREYLGGKGMIMSILVGLYVGSLYAWFMKKDIRIKMPASVPQAVADSFSALIPTIAIISLSTLIFALVRITASTSLFELIYKLVQIPLSNMTDSYFGVLAMAFFMSFFWIFGIHGPAVVGLVFVPIITTNALLNQEIIESGMALTLENGGRIVTLQFLDQFINLSGSGITLGLTFYMFALAKAKQIKTLGKLAIGPNLFGINEPVIFGIPIVFNPIMAVPFFLAPLVSGTIAYLAMYWGLVPLYRGILLPWTVPPILAGLISNGWQAALMQALCLVISFFIYLPFIRMIDNTAYKDEQTTTKGEES